MNEFRLTKQGLWDILEAWDLYLPRKARVVACGGTALALQDMKESTKDVDFLVPDQKERYKETALYDLNPDRMMKNLDYLLAGLKDRE